MNKFEFIKDIKSYYKNNPTALFNLFKIFESNKNIVNEDWLLNFYNDIDNLIINHLNLLNNVQFEYITNYYEEKNKNYNKTESDVKHIPNVNSVPIKNKILNEYPCRNENENENENEIKIKIETEKNKNITTKEYWTIDDDGHILSDNLLIDNYKGKYIVIGIKEGGWISLFLEYEKYFNNKYKNFIIDSIFIDKDGHYVTYTGLLFEKNKETDKFIGPIGTKDNGKIIIFEEYEKKYKYKYFT
jgi:hypothetical protein